jgi:hypothetical protein
MSIRAQERFSRRRTAREGLSFPGADLELCARCRTASVANTDAHQVSTDAGQGTAAEPTGGAPGRSPYQVVQSGFGPARRQCATDAARTGRKSNGSGGSGDLGRSALACHTSRVARRTGRLHSWPWWWRTSKWTRPTSLSAAGMEATPNRCDCWRNG